MRSTVLRDGKFVVTSVPVPEPAQGQVVCRVLACGICGSDLHFVKQRRDLAEGTPAPPSPDVHGSGEDIFMGHEFCAEVVEAGHDTAAPPPGTVVTSVPS